VSVYTPVDYEHDPFDIDPIQRDRWGRPMLKPADLYDGERVAYTRASSLATAICSDYGLNKWKQRRIAKGICDRPDLAAMGSALPVLTGIREQDAPTNRELDFIIGEALIEAGALEQARYGTTIHGHTEPKGDFPRGPVPVHMKADVESFFARLARAKLRIVETEVFVACDELMAAGTFDHIVEHEPTGQRIILEKKTGDLHMFEFLIQVAVYAHGQRYNPHTDERSNLNVSRKTALLAHIPQGAGRTDLYPLDLEHGYRRAMQAKEIRGDQANDAAVAWRLLEDA